MARAIAFVALLVPVAAVLALAASRILYPYDVGHFEAGTWAPAELLVAGRNPYDLRFTETPPFVMAPYGPLFYAAVGLGLLAFGPQLWLGRLVAAAGLAAAAACIALVTRRTLGSRPLAALALATFLAQVPVQAWAAVHRPDALALGLGLAGILLALTRSRAATAVVLPSILAAGAVLARQTTILPAGVIVAWHLLAGRPRRAAAAALVTLGVLGAATAALEVTSHGGYLWQQLVLPSRVERSAAQLRTVLGILAAAPASWVAALLCAGGPIGSILRRRGPASRGGPARTGDPLPTGERPVATSPRIDGPPAGAGGSLPVEEGSEPAADRAWAACAYGYLVLAVALAAATSARAGSNVNYWLEPCAAAALCAPIGWRRLAAARGIAAGGTSAAGRRIAPARGIAAPGVRPLLLLLAAAAAVGAAGQLRAESLRWRARPYFDDVVAALRAQPDDTPCLSVYPELPRRAGRRSWFNDAIQYDGRSPRHHRLLMDLLDARAFGALVLPYPGGPEGYARVALPHPPPEVPPAFLFVRR